MPARPSKLPEWATDGANITEPTSGRIASGWLPRMRPPAQFFNWWKNLAYQWIAWFAQETDARQREQIAHAIAHYYRVEDVLSSSHNWHAGAVSDIGSNGLVSPRYWVVGDDGSGNTAIAYASNGQVPGAGWANETGSAQSGSLNRCAAAGTLCMGVESGGTAWKLGGSTNENGTFPGLGTFNDVIHDPTNNLWIAITTSGIYSSPMTTVSWTQRLSWANARCVAHRDGLLVAAGNDGTYYSTDGINWLSGYTDASANWSTPNAMAANSLGFWIVDAAAGERIFFTPDGVSVTELEAEPSLSAERIFAWRDMICVPGIYMSPDPRLNEWSGVTFSIGVNQRVAGSRHGAIACAGTESVTVFGPTIDMVGVPFAT